jgi:hypothetical protein
MKSPDEYLQLKRSAYQVCQKIMEERLAICREALMRTQESMEGDQKSSMGDKYETGRAMAHLEIEKLSATRSNTEQSIALMTKYPPNIHTGEAKMGSLLQTDLGLFYLLVSVGEIKTDHHALFVISPQSPMGKALVGKKPGDTVEFNQKKGRIISLF